MHVVLTSVGTDGDIIPYVGLGAALVARGHTATLVACERYEPMATASGLGFRPLISQAEHDALFNHPDFWNPLKTAQLSARWGVRYLRRQYELLSGLVTPDTVMVFNPAVFAAMLVHERYGTPWANLVLQPWVIPSAEAPPLIPYFGWLAGGPRWAWKLLSRGIDVVGDRYIGPELNALRADLGLKPLRRVLSNWFSPQRIVGLFPEWFGAPQSDWPPQLRLAGFPMFDSGPVRELPPELDRFLAGGEPPVIFTFGTGLAHSSEWFRASLDACAISGVRGVLLTRFRDQLPAQLPPGVVHCEFAPFQKLFPRCAAVVHHGGVGTIAKALAAGVPQVIQPICFDQADNGLRVKRLGAGELLPSGRPAGARIAKALTQLRNPETTTHCRRLRQRLENTNSLHLAAEMIEQINPARIRRSANL